MIFAKYDLFPYVICQELIGWTDEGNAKTRSGYYDREALINTLPFKEGRIIENKIVAIKNEYEREKEILRRRLLKEFNTVVPFLNKGS